MSSLDSAQVARLAGLARIDLTDEELQRLPGQLSAIVEAVATVSQAVSSDIPATSHPVPMSNVLRPDVVTPSLSNDEALSGAPEAQDGRFRVPRILGEEA